jgi:hypothetical protein
MNVQSPLIQVAAGGTCVDVDFVARRQILEGNTTFQHIGHNGGNYSKANTAGRQRPTKSAAPPPGGPVASAITPPGAEYDEVEYGVLPVKVCI